MAFSSIVKNFNEKIILECIRNSNTYTKQEIAKKAELSFPTVSKIVDELVEKQVIQPLGIQENSQGGRKAAVFQMNEHFAHALTIFFQGKIVYYSVVNALGKTILHDFQEYNDSLTLAHLVEVISLNLQKDKLIKAVSIGVPGSVNNGKVYYIDGYEAFQECDLEKELYEWFQIPVRIINNMNVVALGMADKLSCRDGNIACIHLAETGPGCGAVVNGKEISGFCGFNGEVGFIPFYGERTLQDVALAGFQNVDLGEFIGKIVISLTAILNPKQIVLYIERTEKDWEMDMRRYCNQYLPERVLPEFIISEEYQMDYFYGLAVFGVELLFESV